MPLLSGLASRWIAVVGLCALGGGGCSYMFVDGPPKQHEKLLYFTCSNSQAWPVVDSVIAGTVGVSALSALAAGGSDNQMIASGVALGGLAALFLSSAVSGFHDTSECREGTKELQLRLTRMHMGSLPGAPPAYSDPWLRPMDKPFATPPAPAPEDESPSPPEPADRR